MWDISVESCVDLGMSCSECTMASRSVIMSARLTQSVKNADWKCGVSHDAPRVHDGVAKCGHIKQADQKCVWGGEVRK